MTVEFQLRGSMTQNGIFAFYGFVNAGSSPNGVAKTVYVDIGNLSLPHEPSVVICQPRRNDQDHLNRTEAFAVHVITVGKDKIRLLLRRVDGGNWGDNVRLDMVLQGLA